MGVRAFGRYDYGFGETIVPPLMCPLCNLSEDTPDHALSCTGVQQFLDVTAREIIPERSHDSTDLTPPSSEWTFMDSSFSEAAWRFIDDTDFFSIKAPRTLDSLKVPPASRIIQAHITAAIGRDRMEADPFDSRGEKLFKHFTGLFVQHFQTQRRQATTTPEEYPSSGWHVPSRGVGTTVGECFPGT